MYVKTLTLKGFKSFAHATTFQFEPGVTAVVGPNGSGKSNVVDALAWVMGEQGAKTLRGGKMEDVIFAGTAKKGPLGRAEVVLTIDNSDGALPIDYTEVTISRTLFRSGGSEYAINGRSCRLLDVQELLSDSGLGREMHVIVGQGQLDQVLRATPVERRGFIEEAAGILKHRRRKERTVRKLAAMEANLQRVNDLAGELRRQLKPLGAQAEVARSAQQIQAEVRDAESRLLAAEIVAIDEDLAALGRSHGDTTDQQQRLRARVDELKAALAELERTTVSDELERARDVVRRLETQAERFRSLQSLTGQRVALLSSQPQAFDLDAPAKFAEAQAAQVAARELTEQAHEQSATLDAARALTLQRFEALQAVDAQIAEQSALISRHELRRTELANAVDLAVGRIETAAAQLTRSQQAITEATERRDARAQALAEAQRSAGEGGDNDAAATLDAAYSEAAAALDALDRELAELRDHHAKARSEAQSQRARAQALGMALDTRDGSAALLAEDAAGVQGLVADALSVAPGHEAAVAAALGALAEAVVVDTLPHGLDALGTARTNGLGQVTAVVAQAAAPVAERVLDALPQGQRSHVQHALEVVTGPSGMLALLATTVIVDSQGDVAAVVAALPSGWQAVTPDGDVVAAGVLRGGGELGSSRLQLLAERDEATTASAEAEQATEQLAEALEQMKQRRVQARATRDEALAALRAHDAQAAESAKRLSSLRAQAEAAQAELDRVTEQRAEAERSLAALEEEAASARRALAEFDDRPQPLSRDIDREPAALSLEEARAAELEARVAVETVRERAKAEQRRAETLQREAEQMKAQAQAQARAQAIRSIQLERAEHLQQLLPEVLRHISVSLDQARLIVAEADVRRRQQHARLGEVRAEISAAQNELGVLIERAHGLDLRENELQLRRSAAVERVEAELAVDIDVLVAEYGPHQPIPLTGDWADGAQIVNRDETGAPTEAPADGESVVATVAFDREQQRLRLVKAQRQLTRLGRVNPLALEEFAALEQRYTYMSEQLTDLQNTRRDLLAISAELDEKMQDIFTAAFEDTRRAFDEIFPVLFPGGRGALTLTEPDNPLETGIDVAIRPAGKKIDRLSLLSGGERSLAAVALLVAIFIARPSPFYIMDEVEAALDDANLGRLLSVFERLRADSQLIVITHQKRTMEIADALYGVSMRQDGVSAVVGQRLEREENSDAGQQTPASHDDGSH